MPPKAKIYEAFSAIADNRVSLESQSAIVASSDLKKKYSLSWNELEYSSNDNASFWQGYPGYPIIAVWLLKGILPLKKEIANHFNKINWHELNEKNKRDYDKVVNEILNDLAEKNIDTEEIETYVDKLYEEIEKMNFQIVKKIKSEK